VELNDSEHRPDDGSRRSAGVANGWIGRWNARWPTRLAEAQQVERNPHLAEALEIEKMEGQRIATWARTAALAVVAVLLIFINPRMEMLFYEGVLVLFVLIGFAQLRAARVGQSAAELALIFADLLLLTLMFVLPNPFESDLWPSAIRYHFKGFDYFYIFLASATLAYSWRTVLSIGLWVGIIWLGGALGVYLFGITYPDLSVRMRQAMDGYERVFLILDPNSVNFTFRIQEITIFIVVCAILALKSQRSRQLLIRQAELAAERANLSRYFPPTMVEELARRNEPMGRVRSQDVAVLFADIVGFTRYAESHPPDDVIALLRAVHAALEEVVFSHGGTLDKFMGDGLMASFGTPNASPSDAANAIAAAFAMQDTIERINAARTGKGLEAIRLSVGVHFGSVILGDIGNARRMEFATLGDTVNVAARLEAATRSLSCGIVLSQSAMEAVTDRVLRERYSRKMRFHRGLALKGRNEASDVWIA